MYICYILPVPANDIAIENIFFYTFWFKYSTSIYKYIFYPLTNPNLERIAETACLFPVL